MDTMKDTKMQPAKDAVIEELRMLAEDLHVNGYNRYSSAMSKAADELESLQRYRAAYNEWVDKTEWIQADTSLPAKYLGRHRADALKDRISELEDRLGVAEEERDALRAKIEQMEKQEPVWFIDERGEPKRYHKSKADYCKYGGLDLLYALPGAKGEEK